MNTQPPNSTNSSRPPKLCGNRLIEDDPSLADFLPWFDAQFPATTVGRR